MKALGAVLVEIEIPMVERVPEASGVILFSEAAHYHKERYLSNPDGFSPMDQSRLRQGMNNTVLQYIDAMLLREKIRRAWVEAGKAVDVIAVPTTATPAFKIGTSDEMASMTVEVKGRPENVNESIVRHVRVGTMTGVPAVSIPVGFTSDTHLPVGLSFYGNDRYQDLNVLKAAWAYERNYPFTFYTE